VAVDVAGEPTGGGVSPLPREARPYQGRRAGLVTRLVAAVLDSLVVGVTLLAGYVGVAGFLFLVDPRTFSFPEANLLLSIAMAGLVAEVYLTLSWWLAGRTYGYLVMGLRLNGRGGRSPRFVGSAVRAICCVFFPIGILWVPVSRDNRSVQDLLLGTAVVYDWQPKGPSHQRSTQY
jgi:uncharacterized RDD family membrane protein YckC